MSDREVAEAIGALANAADKQSLLKSSYERLHELDLACKEAELEERKLNIENFKHSHKHNVEVYPVELEAHRAERKHIQEHREALIALLKEGNDAYTRMASSLESIAQAIREKWL